MPFAKPPAACPGDPERWTLPAGTELVRIHSSRFAATAFNPTAPTSSFEGGRFDCTRPGRPPFLYAGQDAHCAVAEALLRDVPTDPGNPRVLLRLRLGGRVMSRIEVTRDLELLSLVGGDLYHVGQDAWLTTCESRDYPHTRSWGDALRRWVPDAPGFVWISRRDQERRAFVFFAPHAETAFAPVGPGIALDDPQGLALVRPLLQGYNVTLE